MARGSQLADNSHPPVTQSPDLQGGVLRDGYLPLLEAAKGQEKAKRAARVVAHKPRKK